MTAPAPKRRYRFDSTVQRFGTTVIGGSPLTLFRLTEAGARLVDRVDTGDAVDTSPLVERLLRAGALHPVPDGHGPFTADDVTVVVPTFGPPRCSPADALVVDDGSDPPVRDAAVRLPTNQGPAAARNAGLAAVTTALVAFVDNDVGLSPNWLESLLPHFADPTVAVVAPRVSATDHDTAVGRYEREHSPLDMGPEPARVRAGSRVSYVPAAALVCRVDALTQLGGFDTTLRYGEDVDLVWRLDDAGYTVRYEPASVVHHEPRSDWRAWFDQRIGYGSSAAPLAARHPGKLAPLRMSGWSLATWVLAVLGRPVAGAAIGLGSAAALIRKLPDVPPRDAFRIAAMGNLRAGPLIAHTVRRAWWPMLAVLAVRSKAARRALALSFVMVCDPRESADDIAYSIGVWKGMITTRTIAPIIPKITSWPGRAPRMVSGTVRASGRTRNPSRHGPDGA